MCWRATVGFQNVSFARIHVAYDLIACSGSQLFHLFIKIEVNLTLVVVVVVAFVVVIFINIIVDR